MIELKQQFAILSYRLLAITWRRRWLLLLCAGATALLSLTLNLTAKDRYVSRTTLLVQESALNNPTLDDWSVAINLKERIGSLRVLVQSRHVLSQVLEDLSFLQPEDARETQALYQRLAAAIRIELIGENLIELTVTWEDQEQVAILAESISHHFRQRLLAPGAQAVVQSEQFLEQQLNQQQLELLEAEAELSVFKRENATVLPSLYGATHEALQKVEHSLRQTRLNLQGARQRHQNYADGLISTNPVISELETRIVALEADLTLLRARYTDQHSQVRAVLARLQQLQGEKQRLLQQVKAMDPDKLDQLWQLASGMDLDPEKGAPLLVSQLQALQSAKAERNAMEAELAMLESQKAELVTRIGMTAEVERSLKALERDVSVKRAIYTELQTRYEKARVSGDLGRFEEPDKTKVIDAPTRPLGPANTPAVIAFLAGLIAGLGLGAALVTVIEFIDGRLYTNQQIQQLAGVPVLARRPNW
ncbi:hypothetical protein KUV89_02630 [Marinobacter hydrocarbonoclasticus]|nr:hypothetical protein [Marinobacter nauticus]